MLSLAVVDMVECASNQTVLEGGTITLNCSAKTDASSSATIVWKKDGKELNVSSARVHISGGGSPSQLTITGAKREDAGLYQCVARNNNSGAIEACPEARVIVHCK